ncbi:MAG: CoA-binding protein [Candidatus Woesearchaeota archaeon]
MINLDIFFNPKSVAVIGASRKKNSAGQGILKSLLKGGVFFNKSNKTFKGKLFPVNPNAKKILGKKCYPSILDIKSNVDLAIISLNSKIVLNIVKECAKKKVKGIIIISAGFSELGNEGKNLEEEILNVAKKNKIRILGPNCLGLIRPGIINASFGPCMPEQGEIAFFSQSGALIDSVIDWSLERKYGFSSIVSLGNQADLDITDFLEWALYDKKTKAIALYIEGLKDGKKFMEIAKKVSKIKPIVALKAGKSETGIKAVSSHTGSLAGSYDVYKTAFKQSGIILADNVEDLFEVAQTLANQPACLENNIAIITNGGGAGVLCADHCETLGIKLAKLSDETIKKLDESKKMHPAYSKTNPLDLIGDALHDRYKVAIDTLLKQKDIHGLIVIQTLQTMTESVLDAYAIIEARKKFPKKPIIANYMGGKYTKKSINLLEANNLTNFNNPYKSAVHMKALIDRGDWLKKIKKRIFSKFVL